MKRVKKLSALGMSLILATGLGIGVGGCSDATDDASHTTTVISTTAADSADQNVDGKAPQQPLAPLEVGDANSSVDTTTSGGDGYVADSTVGTLPQTPTPGQIGPEQPAVFTPGDPLPQANLDSKYAPLGVPVMAGPDQGKPFVFTTTFTREQTVALHEKQVGEKIQQVGDAMPVAGEPISTMGSAIAQSSAFASQHEDTCVRAWVEIAPGYWGTYATYVTGDECPEETSHTYQLPW